MTNRRLAYLNALGIQPWVLKETKQMEENIVASPVEIKDWDELNQAIQSCQNCPRFASRQQAITGFGATQADLMIISEPPSFEEDQKKAYFIGESGQLLTNMLFAIGLNRNQVFITPCLKCANDELKRTEKTEACQHWLKMQINFIQPRSILVLGQIAANQFLDCSEKISILRQQSHQFQDIPVITTYHPKYLLKRPSAKAEVWIDLQKIKIHFN